MDGSGPWWGFLRLSGIWGTGHADPGGPRGSPGWRVLLGGRSLGGGGGGGGGLLGLAAGLRLGGLLGLLGGLGRLLGGAFGGGLADVDAAGTLGSGERA